MDWDLLTTMKNCKKFGTKNLFEDGLHLNDDGKVILANNFIYVLNSFSYETKKSIMALVRMIFYSSKFL